MHTYRTMQDLLRDWSAAIDASGIDSASNYDLESMAYRLVLADADGLHAPDADTFWQHLPEYATDQQA